MDATSAKCLLTIGGNSIYYVSKFYYFFIPLDIEFGNKIYSSYY